MVDISSMLYDAFMKPLEIKGLSKKRKKLISKVHGNVLEIGTGTGANFEFYNYKAIKSLTLLDLSFSKKVLDYNFSQNITLNFVSEDVENLSFQADTFDSIVFTLVFCSVSNPMKGLEEICRVLKPRGKIYFIEHVLSDHHLLHEAMNKINPIWSKVANGCNINRDTHKLIKQANFAIIEYKAFWKNTFITGIGLKNGTK